MTVHVHKARHQVHAIGIQFFTTFFEFRSVSLIDGDTRITHYLNLLDDVVFNYNINGSTRRRSVPVDQGYPSND